MPPQNTQSNSCRARSFSFCLCSTLRIMYGVLQYESSPQLQWEMLPTRTRKSLLRTLPIIIQHLLAKSRSATLVPIVLHFAATAASCLDNYPTILELPQVPPILY